MSLTQTTNLYHLKEQHTIALQHYEEALNMYEKLFPDTYQINYHVGEIFFNIGNIHSIKNNLHIAQQYAENALDIFRATSPPEYFSRIAAEESIDKTKRRLEQQL